MKCIIMNEKINSCDRLNILEVYYNKHNKLPKYTMMGEYICHIFNRLNLIDVGENTCHDSLLVS